MKRFDSHFAVNTACISGSLALKHACPHFFTDQSSSCLYPCRPICFTEDKVINTFRVSHSFTEVKFRNKINMFMHSLMRLCLGMQCESRRICRGATVFWGECSGICFSIMFGSPELVVASVVKIKKALFWLLTKTKSVLWS